MTGPSTGRRWALRMVALFLVWLVVALVAWVFGNQPHPGLLALVLGAGAAILWLLLDVSADAEPARWPVPAEEPVRPPGEDDRLELLHRVVCRHQDSHEPGDRLFRHLTELADHRLVARSGVSLQADPERAVALLDPDLAAVVTAHPPYPRLTNDQIDRILTRIEAL